MTLSRRRVLAALAAAGGAGALTGSGTGALLRDDERFGAGLTAGTVDIVGEYWLLSGPGADGDFDPEAPDGTVDGPHVDVPVGLLTDAEPTGSLLLRFALPQDGAGVNNPARVWLRTECPPANTLAEFLQVRLSYADADGTRIGPITNWRSLRELADLLRTGYHLDPDGDPTDGTHECLTDELFVLVEYDLGSYVGTETVALPLYVAAVQCRNADPTSPFPESVIDEECEVGYTCECCWAIGKVELDDAPFAVGETYEFTEGLVGYAIHVTGVDGDSGVAFELVATDGRTVPPLCAVHVKGGPDDERYERRSGEIGFDTTVLDGASDGLVSAPPNPNSGGRYGISYVLVKVCAPTVAGGDCPEDLVTPAASVGGTGNGGGTNGPTGDPDGPGTPPGIGGPPGRGQ